MATKMTTHTSAVARRSTVPHQRSTTRARGGHRGFSGGSRRAEPVRRPVHHRATCLICSSGTNPAAAAATSQQQGGLSAASAGLRVHRTGDAQPGAASVAATSRSESRETREKRRARSGDSFDARGVRVVERGRGNRRVSWSLPTQPWLSALSGISLRRWRRRA